MDPPEEVRVVLVPPPAAVPIVPEGIWKLNAPGIVVIPAAGQVPSFEMMLKMLTLPSCLYDFQCLLADTNLDVCNVMMADDMFMANEDQSFWNWTDQQQGRVDLLHEFGHVLGLGHSSGWQVMNPGDPLPLVGGSGSAGSGSTAEPYPDDVAGIYRYYEINDSMTNVFATAEKPYNGYVTRVDANDLPTSTSGESTLILHPGDGFL